MNNELQSISANNAFDFYYNDKNIANQDLVLSTVEYFETGVRKEMFKPLDFLNLLWQQYNYVCENIETPHTVLTTLKALQLTTEEQHILFGFILKWFGGYPINNANKQYNTTLKLIEKEFLNYPDVTNEKIFCSKNHAETKQLNEATIIVGAAIGAKPITSDEASTNIYKKYNFSQSRYIQKIDIDFEDLPEYIIRKGIVWNFEQKELRQNSDYAQWQNDLADFINSIPNNYRLKALKKGIEYGNKVYKYHLDNECTSQNSCRLNETWERRIALTESMLHNVLKQIEATKEETTPNTTEKNKEFTTARQVIAMHLIFDQLQVRATEVDRSQKANFIEFLTGKNNKNIYTALANPFETKEKYFRYDDLQYVRDYFEKLGLSAIVKEINKQLEANR